MSDYKIKGDKNPKIKLKNVDKTLKFFLGNEDLAEPDEFEHFIRSCEDMVRNDPRYKNYISELREAGFTKDVLQSGIDSNTFPNTKIEMHHGPLFTLFDICSIVVDHKLAEGEKLTEFDVADLVLTEHEKHHIGVVMLTKTNHELVGAGRAFIHMKQSTGDVMKFIKAYKKGIKREHLYTLERYITLCEKYDATDNDMLELRKVCKKVSKYIDNNDE